MEKDIKSKKTIVLIAVFAISLVLLGAALFYSLKTPGNNGAQNQPASGTQSQEQIGATEPTATAPDGTPLVNKDDVVTYKGQTLTADSKYPRGILDGVIKKVDGNVVTFEVELKRVFPQSPLATKTVQVTLVKTAEVNIISADGNKTTGTISGLKAEDRAGMALVDDQSNRTIFDKDAFDATRITVFK